MTRNQLELLRSDLEKALLKVNDRELETRRGFVKMALDEFDQLEPSEKGKENPVNYLDNQYSDRSFRDLALYHLILAEILALRIEMNGEENKSKLTNFAIGAINRFTIYNEKSELAKKRTESEIKKRNTDTVNRLNIAKHEPLNALVARILELYEPTIESLRRDSKPITYLNIARRIEPDIRSANRQSNGRYLLGGANDPVGAIKRRLETAVRDSDLKSTREYKKQ